jgi:hypothetical protein
MKPHYFVFESGVAVIGPCKRFRDAEVEAKEYGTVSPVVRCFETDSKETAEEMNKDFERALARHFERTLAR